MITAEEFLKQEGCVKGEDNNLWMMISTSDVIEFAKLCVTEALKEASENATMQIEETNSYIRYKSRYSSKDNHTVIVAKDSILNSYNLDNIK